MKNIKVFVKVKNDLDAKKHELLEEEQMIVKETGNQLVFDKKYYEFSQVFGEDYTQKQVYDQTCKDPVELSFQGYNVTMFVFGPSGSGKTYTMLGPDEWIETFAKNEPSNDDKSFLLKSEMSEEMGIIPRVIHQVFDKIYQAKQEDPGVTYKLSGQYFEIYMEKIYDLINYTSDGHSINDVTRNKNGHMEVPVTKKLIELPSDCYKMLKIGQKHKKEASTFVNDRSSRSHTVFTLEIVSRTQSGRVKRSKLNLIDLAGSERYKNLGESETLHKESNEINKSLLYLGTVIEKLSRKESHIPFRNSLLTKYLTDTLGKPNPSTS
jgi:kinesin family protein 5